MPGRRQPDPSVRTHHRRRTVPFHAEFPLGKSIVQPLHDPAVLPKRLQLIPDHGRQGIENPPQLIVLLDLQQRQFFLVFLYRRRLYEQCIACGGFVYDAAAHTELIFFFHGDAQMSAPGDAEAVRHTVPVSAQYALRLLLALLLGALDLAAQVE